MLQDSKNQPSIRTHAYLFHGKISPSFSFATLGVFYEAIKKDKVSTLLGSMTNTTFMGYSEWSFMKRIAKCDDILHRVFLLREEAECLADLICMLHT